ncbi:MAG: SLOG family protein [Eubacteriales bacterium]|nr:SLOG family protein [Eubacteriales bacterium]
MSSCCFTGHRELPRGNEYLIVAAKTRAAILDAVNQGCTRFIAGGAIGFDMLAESMVLRLRDNDGLPITLTVYVSFRGQEMKLSIENQKRYRDIICRADEVKTLSEGYFSGCYQARNRAMVDDAAVCIAYCTKAASGTGMTVKYAQLKGVPVIRI